MRDTEVIITNNLGNTTIPHKLVILRGANEFEFNISDMFKNEDNYIEINAISKAFNKRINQWLKNKGTQEYIELLKDYLRKEHNYTKPLIKREAGRYGGTYLHKKLALKYFRWLDKKFEIAIDLFLEQLYKQITVTKINRADTKSTFKPLTSMIANKYLPHHVGSIRYNRYSNLAYSDLLDLINVKVLGKTAKQFRTLHNIPDKKSIHTRDYLTELQLKNIRKFQQALYNILEMDILELEDIKKMIDKMSLITEDNQHNFI